MEEISRVPMVTIPLQEYDRLRDESMMNRIMIDKIVLFETRINDMQRQMYDLNNRK